MGQEQEEAETEKLGEGREGRKEVKRGGTAGDEMIL